ncbi:MAG: hypothetical protein KF752_13065 [Pirellulaceae bacterium]|nr:hypothetical protein [Pirellulaceae bacterium]
MLYHHEAVDGSGYPEGLRGDKIPLMARVLAVADAWDAMTSDRPYRPGMQADKAISILISGAGSQWDPVVVQAFLDSIDTIMNIISHWRDVQNQFCKPNQISSSIHSFPVACKIAAAAKLLGS